MWSSYKAFNSMVTDVLVNNRIDQLMEFEAIIKKHRLDLLNFNIYKDSKSIEDRQSVTRADVEAISIPGLSQKILLTRDLIEETCKLSDLFNLNEIKTLELLLTAEGHLSAQSSTLSRLSLAISLYYDAHSLLSDALRTIISHRIGRIPSNNSLSRDIAEVVASFTDDLWQSGLLEDLLSFLRSFNTIEEYKRLDSARMIESRRHRYDILHHFAAIRNRIAETIMLWAAQTPFSAQEFSQILTHLVDFQRDVAEARKNPEDESAPLDHGSIHLLVSLLCSLEPFGTPGIIVDQYSDLNEQDLQHPLYWQKGYISAMTDILTPPGDPDHHNYPLAVEGIYGLLQIAWGITLRRTAHLRSDLRRRRGGDGDVGIDAADSVDDDELITTALRSRAMFLLLTGVLGASHFQQESMWVRRVHSLFTELLINFPQNVRDLRLWDESMVRRMGVDPGGFAVLLDALCRLYDVPGSPLHARLSLEFWWPSGETRITGAANTAVTNVAGTQGPQSSESGSATAALNASFRAGEVENSRQVSNTHLPTDVVSNSAILFRFVYSTSEFASSPVIFVPYVKVLRALVGSQTSANLCFNLLKATATSGGRLASLLTWDHFITSLHQYLDHLKSAAAAAAAATYTTTTVGGQQLPPHLQYPHLYAPSIDAFPPPPPSGYSLLTQQQQLVNQHVQPMDMQQQTSTPATPEIQPEELDALRSVVGLITRVCFMDPVARSAFASNTKWSLVSTAIGLITCPLPMSMKADLLHLLAALARTPSIAAEIWCALIESRLLAFIDPQSMVMSVNGSVNAIKGIVGLHTEMDKAEARHEEYPITQAFLNLLTTLAPSLLTSSVGVNEPPFGGLDPCEGLSRLVHFTSENIFLKHTMRAYRHKNERWEIAAACLNLFEGLIQAFIRRMRAVAVFAAGADNCSEEQLALFDWSALLTGGHLKSTKLKLPHGWPFTDPGYQIVTQLLINSSLFSLMTGLLEVGFYRLMEYDLTPSYAMNRATAAILRIFEHILPHEQILVNLVRRASLLVPHLRPETAWGQRSGVDIIMPSLLSRLLVVTINSRTGRADLLITIVRYCGLYDDLPDHCSSALNILYNVVRAEHSHEPVLAIFTNDQKTENELLRALVSCLSTSIYDMSDCHELSSITEVEVPIFSDSWLYDDAPDESVDGGYKLATTSVYAPHPAFKAAHLLASFPTVRWNWTTEEISRWELMTTFAPTQGNAISEMVKGNIMELDSMWSFGSSKRSVRSTMLHMILYSLTNHSSPSIGHWLLGFRCKNARTIALTTIQNAGVGGYPSTCLHGILDLIELGVASLRENLVAETIDAPPHISLLTQQWDSAMAWQILYHLMAASATTAVPIARYLRGTHDFVARHLTTGLVGVLLASSVPRLSSCNSLETASSWSLQSLILNQCSWLLKMGAIEVQSSTSQRTYLARILTNLFTIGENSVDTNGTVGTSFINHFASALTYSDLTEPQNRVLADLLSRMTPSETLIGPQWIFDRDCVDSKLMENIVVACEEASPLISTEEHSTLRTCVINTSSLVSRLSVFFGQGGLVNATIFEEGADANTLALGNLRLCTDVVEWARRRNTHRLALVLGKQACLEGWRHLTEIGLRMLHFLARTSPDILSTSASIPVNRSLYSATMALLNPLLHEVSAPESTPAVLKVLASGSALSLSAFLQIFASPTSADGSMLLSSRATGIQNILSVTQLLLEAILTSKPNHQRVRANYYGALCYILDVCHQFDQQISASSVSGTSEIPITLQVINILAGIDGDHFNSSFLTVLFSDISNGHHPIIPISAIGLLCSLLKLDRTSGQVLETVVRDGCLQFCIDSLEDDLAVLQQHLVSQNDSSIIMGRDVNENKEQADATAVFYVYQSKMALLTLIASTQLGAKSIIQTSLLDSTLCRFEPLSGSCLADVFDFSVASVRNNPSASNTTQFDPLHWLDTYEFSQHLLDSLNRQELGESFGCSPLGVINPLVTSQLLSASGSSLGVTADPGQCLTWSGILSPALAFTKTLVFTLGPTHVSAVQKVSKFVYTHSEALLTVGASATAAQLVAALSQEAFQDCVLGSETSIERQEQLVQATLQWLHGEESLTHLLSFILRARIPLNLGEPDDLPRELLRSKILRHIFAIMPDSLQALQIKEQRGVSAEMNPMNNARQTFVRNLVTTKQLELLCLQVNTCVAAVSTEDEFDGLDNTLVKNLIFSSSLTSNDSGSEATLPNPTRPGLNLLFQLASWVSSRLHHLEGQVTSLSRHLPANLLNSTSAISSSSPISESGRVKEEGKSDSAPALDRVLRCLVQLPVSLNSSVGDISTDSLRQIATSVFSVWSPMVFPLLQTNGTAGTVDAGQRNAFLRRLISLGAGLLQTQLSCFVGELYRLSSYLLWRHLACFLVSAGKPEAQSNFVSGVSHQTPRRFVDNDFIEQLPRKLTFDLLESIAQISKAPYLSSSDQLFLQVMAQRLERLSQARNRVAASEHVTA
ncbi:unnamed protein product [Rodentolepis nana]|uniref:Nucleoporin Nup186/Nup192/Nup205 n=1 Tax=Rodentolepis nana TaxID=102285 RepID=A0A158QIN4_RODNA|nr:unnamed protein product [Rodentolepis nana]